MGVCVEKAVAQNLLQVGFHGQASQELTVQTHLIERGSVVHLNTCVCVLSCVCVCACAYMSEKRERERGRERESMVFQVTVNKK